MFPFSLYIFIFVSMFSFLVTMFLIFLNFRGNSLNSRDDLEFKEFRFSKNMKFSVFFEKHRGKKNHCHVLEKYIFFQIDHRGKKRNS